MTAQNTQRRKMTAKETAARFGVSERTVRRLIAEPREDFLARAAARRKQAVDLRLAGMKYTQIAEQMETSTGAVGRLLRDARLKDGANV